MSRRSRRSRNIPRFQGLPRLLIQVLVGALLAIAIGVLLGKLYLARILAPPPAGETERVAPEAPAEAGETGQEGVTGPGESHGEEEGEEPEAEEVITTTVPPLSLFRVQVGAFSQEQNAEGFLARLEELGFRGVISGGGGIYRVSAGLFAEKKLAQDFAARLVSIGDILEGEPLVVAETLGEKNISHGPQEEGHYRNLVQIIEETEKIARKMEALWLAYLSGEKTPGQVMAEAEKVEGEIKTLENTVQLELPSDLSHLQEELAALPADLAATLGDLKRQVEGGGKWAPFSHSLARLVKLWPQLT